MCKVHNCSLQWSYPLWCICRAYHNLPRFPYNITVTSLRAWWRLKPPASRLFTQPFIQAKIKESIKALCHWPLRVEITGDRWIPLTKDQQRHHEMYGYMFIGKPRTLQTRKVHKDNSSIINICCSSFTQRCHSIQLWHYKHCLISDTPLLFMPCAIVLVAASPLWNNDQTKLYFICQISSLYVFRWVVNRR